MSDGQARRLGAGYGNEANGPSVVPTPAVRPYGARRLRTVLLLITVRPRIRFCGAPRLLAIVLTRGRIDAVVVGAAVAPSKTPGNGEPPRKNIDVREVVLNAARS